MMGDGSVGHVDASYLAGMEAIWEPVESCDNKEEQEMDGCDEEVRDEEV